MAEKKTPVKAKTAAKSATEVKTLDQLKQELEVKRTDQLDAKRSHAAGELVNPHVLTQTRKQIARLHTAIRAAEIAAKETK